MKNLDDIKQKAKDVRNEFVLVNVGTVLLGLFLVFFPGLSTDIICIATGILLSVWGIFKFIDYGKMRKNHIFGSFAMVKGFALLGIGIYILFDPKSLAAFILALLSIALLVAAGLKLQYAFDLLYMESPTWWVQLIGAVIMCVCGIIALVNPFGASNAIMIFLGISFIVSGIWDLVTLIRFNILLKDVKKGVKKTVKQAKKKIKEQSRMVDAEAVDVSDSNDDD